MVPDLESLRITGELTIEAWVKEDSRGTYSKIVSRRSSNYFYFLGVANGKPYGGIGDGLTFTVTTQTVTMPLNEWHHLAFVYNDVTNTMYLYYDGVPKETVTVTESLPAPTGVKLSIGADFQGTANFFNGTVDEVRIWKTALSQNQLSYYVYGGILPPIKPDGTSVFKLGSTVPVKFQLQDADGNSITNAVAGILLQKIVGGDPYGTPMDGDSTSAATTGNLFRYDSTSNQYIFNLGTKLLSEGTWQIRIELGDGSSQLATIGLR